MDSFWSLSWMVKLRAFNFVLLLFFELDIFCGDPTAFVLQKKIMLAFQKILQTTTIFFLHVVFVYKD